jgi:hypothetical protein
VYNEVEMKPGKNLGRVVVITYMSCAGVVQPLIIYLLLVILDHTQSLGVYVYGN